MHSPYHQHLRINTAKRLPSSAPATPKTELGEYRIPFAMSQLSTKKEPDELLINSSQDSAAAPVAMSPSTPKQSPLSFMPPSPASGMSPTRKESYKDLITRAISSHPDKLMTLSDIYAWIVANVETYRDQSHIPSTQGWKNAIRHTLSFYKCFKRVKRHPSIEKPSYWTIDYNEQTTAGSSSALVPPSPKSSPMCVPGITTSAISRPKPSTVRPEEIPDERNLTSQESDLRAWATNWAMRSDAHASKEEQCIQGLLLFRTSAGFSFLPQSSESTRVQPNVSAIPKYPSATRSTTDINKSDQLTYPYSTSRFENGTARALGHIQPTTGCGSVTVVVDTLAGSNQPPLTTSTWTIAAMKEQEQNLNKRRPQFQKHYVEAVVPVQQRQQPKHESVSYVQLIANAILATPEKRATLAQIYEWLVANVAAFQGQGASPSSVGWKNAVRHTLSTRPFFKRVILEESFGRQKPAWWTVDVEAMNLASSLRQQHGHLKIGKRKKNGIHETNEPSISPSMNADQHVQRSANESVIRRLSEANAVILEKAASEPPEPVRIAAMTLDTDRAHWTASGYAAIEKEVVSSPEAAIEMSTFRFLSSSISSGSTTSTISTLSTIKSEFITSETQKYQPSTMDITQQSVAIKNAIYESALGLNEDIFECLLEYLMESLQSSSTKALSPRDALTFTLLRLRHQSLTLDLPRKSGHYSRRHYLRWLLLLASHLEPLIMWPNGDAIRLPPPYLTDRLISFERMKSPQNVIGILDILTIPVILDYEDECCRKTINAIVVYNFDGAIIYRSNRLYWLGCINHTGSFQHGLCDVINDCMENELKERIGDGTDDVLLMFTKVEDILPHTVHMVRSRLVRNVLKEKFSDRLSNFDILTKPILLTKKHSRPLSTLTYLDIALTACCGLNNLSPAITWDYDGL